ncbi:hypothetical protein [Sediminitomix flava]|uniref:SpoIIAA-like protein n=1 Tax=Sediminitomix flava TaxID=379075 RepID=A0A315Z965_SEDFL|nr:hypothetical protein [Sediminitomix flava]PWJ42105.1 hypothetical protein BC781_103355 [Sediminitomix flava]
MDTNYTISLKTGYIHVKAKGINDFDTTLDMWKDIISSCKKYNCYNILGETVVAEKIDFKFSFDMIEIFKRVEMNMSYRIAWVNHAFEIQEEFNFIETVLKNRCIINGHLFNNIEDAQKWILLETDSATA